jgi:hypothetical protein
LKNSYTVLLNEFFNENSGIKGVPCKSRYKIAIIRGIAKNIWQIVKPSPIKSVVFSALHGKDELSHGNSS